MKNNLKGIVLAGGSGSRLYPATLGLSKQLVTVYNKPMIYYPISVLMLAGIRDILIITTSEDQNNFERLLGNGNQFGCNFTYKIQNEPKGLAEAFLIGREFIDDSNVTLILGDNIFYGAGFGSLVREVSVSKGACIFGTKVKHPERFGVVELNKEGTVKSIQEKPEHPVSNLAIPGLYFYDNTVVEKVKTLTPSSRGELEITDLNKLYMNDGQLQIKILPRGTTWFDTGTPDSLFEAISFVKLLESNTQKKVACLEEIALIMGFINKEEFIHQVKKFKSNEYGLYLEEIIK